MGSHFVWTPCFPIIFLLGHNHCYRLLWLQDQWQTYGTLFKDLVAFSGGGGKVENRWLLTMYWYRGYNSFPWVFHMAQAKDKAVPRLLLRLKRGRQEPLQHHWLTNNQFLANKLPFVNCKYIEIQYSFLTIITNASNWIMKMFIEKRPVFKYKMLGFVIYTHPRQNWIVT